MQMRGSRLCRAAASPGRCLRSSGSSWRQAGLCCRRRRCSCRASFSSFGTAVGRDRCGTGPPSAAATRWYSTKTLDSAIAPAASTGEAAGHRRYRAPPPRPGSARCYSQRPRTGSAGYCAWCGGEMSKALNTPVRSPDISTTSAPSMATSVPVPMAMPDIGRRQCRRVVDAVADKGQRATGSRSRSSAATLPSGSTSATTMSMPSSRGDGFGGALVVAGDHRHRQAHARAARRWPRASSGLIGSATANHGRDLPVDRRIERGLALLLQPRQPWSATRRSQSPSRCISRSAPTRTVAAVHRRRHAEAGHRAEPRSHGRLFSPRCLGRAHDRLGNRVFRLRLDGGHDAQHLGLVQAPAPPEIGHLRPPGGQRAGLVEGHDPRLAQHLQRIALAKQHAHFGRPPGADHDRGRRRQPHRAGAGDDQHRHPGDQRKAKRRIRAEDQPDQHVSAASTITAGTNQR